MSKLVTLTRPGRNARAALGRAWSDLWFQNLPTTPLELARIGVGMAALFHYALATPYLFELWGDAGWMPSARVLETYDPWKQSIFFYFTAPWLLPCRLTAAPGRAPARGCCKSRWRCCSSTAPSASFGGTTGGPAMRSGSCSPPTSTTTVSPWIC